MENAAQRALNESPCGWTEDNKIHAPKLSQWVEEKLAEGFVREEILMMAFMGYEGLFLMTSDVAEKTINYTIDDYQ